VNTEKTVLILTDDAEPTLNMAREIASALKGHKVKLTAAAGFAGTDLLPSDILFIGCEKPNPPSFACIAKMLKHINLAGRSCGVFSPGNAQALKYLSGLVRDSEIFNSEPLMTDEPGEIAPWAKAVIKNHGLQA
jgi:hypothetical protein